MLSILVLIFVCFLCSGVKLARILGDGQIQEAWLGVRGEEGVSSLGRGQERGQGGGPSSQNKMIFSLEIVCFVNSEWYVELLSEVMIFQTLKMYR